ncbi:MAG: glycosyltransferase, partial [Thiothrix sp.]|nr:glycosyltransferase [Thiothrix sp.]
RVQVIRNPVITPELLEQAQAPVTHPWLNPKTVPVIMGAGRLSHQKDFRTLLEAFAQVRQVRDCRLIIAGEGGLRTALEQRVAALGLEAVVSLPGFQANLPAWLQKADLFVLSSRWEGSPNVLTEALALGVPVVSTRCPSGPDEVL